VSSYRRSRSRRSSPRPQSAQWRTCTLTLCTCARAPRRDLRKLFAARRSLRLRQQRTTSWVVEQLCRSPSVIRTSEPLEVGRGTGGRSRDGLPTGFGGIARTSGRDPFGLAAEAGNRSGTPPEKLETAHHRSICPNGDAGHFNGPPQAINVKSRRRGCTSAHTLGDWLISLLVRTRSVR
jgi:hypothetical protein